MHRIAILCALLLTVISPVAAQELPPRPPSEPVIVTSGQGVIKRAPDRAWVMLTAESRARTPREAQKLNADAMSKVMQSLKGLVPPDAIRTLAYDLQPEYDYVSGRQTLRAYVARNSVEVRIDDIAKVGEVLDAGVTAGITNAGGIRFDLKERDAVEREALKTAVADARARAEAAASGAGLTVTRVIRIEDHRMDSMPPPRPVMMAMRAEAGQVASAEPPVAPGEIEIRASVTLTAAVK